MEVANRMFLSLSLDSLLKQKNMENFLNLNSITCKNGEIV